MIIFSVFLGKQVQLSSSFLSSGGLVGSICGATVWNRVLTLSDITNLYSGDIDEGVIYETTDEQQGLSLLTINPLLINY